MKPIRQTVIVGLTRSDVAEQWKSEGAFKPSLRWLRPDYFSTVLHETGAKVAYVKLMGFDVIKATMIQAIMDRGVEVDGKVMHLAFITQRKGMSAPLPLVDLKTARRANKMFPRVVDTVRMGALLTPMRGGVAKQVMAKVLIADPKDPRFQLGDGQGVFAADWMPQHLLHRQKMQFRAILHGIRDGVDALAKGTLLKVADKNMHGYDLVLTKNEVKGGHSPLPLGEYEVPVTIGVMQGHRERMSGHTTFGRQFMQHMTDEFFKHPDTVAHVKSESARLHELARRPLELARDLAMRNSDGDVNRQSLLSFAVKISEEIGNNTLLFSGLIRRLLSEALADRCRNLAVSGGMEARYYMLTADNNLPVGTIALSGRAVRNHPAKSVAGRNPHTEAKGAVAVNVVKDVRVAGDFAAANELTMIDAAADVDGDAILIASGTAPQIALWHEMQARIARDNGTKVRQNGTPPQSKAEMVAIALNSNVGMIERTQANWIAARHIHGDEVSGYISRRRTPVHIPTLIELLSVEMQKAVDGVKTGAVPNMKMINELMLLSDQFINRSDIGYIPLDNGTLPMFRCAPVDPKKLSRMASFDVGPGEYIIPENYVSDKTPLGRHMRKVQEMVPHVALDALPNAVFDGWLHLIPGEGAQAAKESNDAFNAAMAATRLLPEDEQDDARAEAIMAFREEWREHFTSKDNAWLRSAASQFWCTWVAGNSDGYTLWHGLPEVWGAMLIERKDKLSAKKPVTTGKIIGSKFAGALDDQASAWLDVTVYERQGVLWLKTGNFNHKVEHANVKPGKYVAHIKRGATGGQFAATFHPEGYVLPEMVQKSPEPEFAPEADVEMVEVPFLTLTSNEEMDEEEMAELAGFDPNDYVEM